MLPSDFDIFSASVSTMPLCIQMRAKGRAAAVDRERGAQLGLGHHRALDVPGGATSPPGRVPARVLALLARFPEREVEWALLERLRARLLALVHVPGTAVGELAVALEAGGPEVDVAARLVGVAALDEVGYQGDDAIHGLRGQGLRIGAPEAEPVGVLEVGAR